MYPQVFGKYVLERELSRGGMARVVLATLRGAGGFEKKLVVKQIRDELSFDQQFVRRFVEEAKTTVALSHPNIVPVYELGVEQGTYFLAMELVEGCSIAEVVRERTASGGKRVLSPEQGAYVGMELCRALDYAHRRMKVVHRDITPRNVMLDEEGQVKLIDFGIAAPALVAGQEILGSPGHMPPEQVEGKELGPPTDIFAVAVLLMEAWSGVAPFRRATPDECDLAMQGPHPKPSDFNPRLIPLDDVIVRAMKLDPRERQQEASKLGRALRAFLQGIDVTDIARELGDRVRDLRQGDEADPMPVSFDGGGRAMNPSAGDLGTKTFAARDETIRWSSPPPSSDSEQPGASTRRLRESLPAPSELLEQTPVASARERQRERDPVMSVPTPLMIEPVGALEEVVLRDARAAEDAARASSAPSRRRADVGLDTLATRPIETPVRVERSAAAEPATRRSRAWLVLAGVAIAGAGAGAAWSATSSRDRPVAVTTQATDPTSATSVATPPRVASTATATTSSATATAQAASAASAAAPPVKSAPATAPPVAATASSPGMSGTPSTPTASTAEKSGRALVSLLGDPGTRVSIDGASRGACPVRVSLEAGQHEVRFSFDPTGESRGERFNVKAGEKVTVRAEFTGATPMVRIQR